MADVNAPELEGIAARLLAVQRRVAEAAERAGRGAAEVALLAVSKRHPAEAVRAAYAAGQRTFGENYVQELVLKAEALKELPGLRWHLIGHLQRNKAKLVVPWVTRVSSVDSPRVADALSAPAERLGRRVEVLASVNLAAEASKAGCAPSELGALLAHIEALPGLKLMGLMAIPPAGQSAEVTKGHFEALVALQREHGGAARLPELSMGMSDDLELAIEAGSTEVRVGTAIFGARGS